jgi:hypothetical protein
VAQQALPGAEGVARLGDVLYAAGSDGIHVLDVTDVAHPRPVTMLPLEGAHKLYLARTYAYVAAEHQGLVILDIENPERPVVDQVFNAGGCINDLHDVKLGATYANEFAYLADGKNGLRVVQLTSTETPGYQGFSPRPTPRLIATFPLPNEGHALAVSEGIDRDRAIDESGNQIAVFGRVGARPLNLEEQRRMYLHDGWLWKVSDDPRDPMYRLSPGALPAGGAPRPMDAPAMPAPLAPTPAPPPPEAPAPTLPRTGAGAR